MKNFFKKLSFVLALAMVLTSLYVPADASAAATNFVVTKHSGKSYSKSNPLYIYIGGFVQNLDYSINGKKSGVAGTWESSKPAVVDVDAKTGALTAKKLGSAVVTFTTKDGKTKVATAVKVRARAASAKFYVKGEDGTNTVIDSIDVEEGATAEVRVALPVNKKAKAAGATKSSYFVQETEVADTAIASVEQAGEGYMESRILTISGKTDGTTTLTITANSETKNAKYEKTAELTINVGSGKITAEQAGANTIKVTGKNLTDVVADYAVKRNNIVVNIKSVKLNDAKTEAILTASANRLTAGDYTLSFKESEPVAFKVVSTNVAKIIIDPETAILEKNSTKSAIAYYKVLNEFDEPITNFISNLAISGSDIKETTTPGQVKFYNPNGYIVGLSQVSLVIVDKTNGVNVSKILPIGAEKQLTTIEYQGVYTNDNANVKKVETLTEGDKNNDLYLVYVGKDQYGANVADGKDLQVNVANAVGFNSTATFDSTFTAKVAKTIPGALAFKLVPSDAKITRPGTITVLAVNTKNGATDSQTIEVAAAVKIDTLVVSVDTELYDQAENVLNVSAVDTNGNDVAAAKIASLLAWTTVGQKNIYDNTNKGTISAAVQKDGSLKVTYKPNLGNTYAQPSVLTFMTETNKVVTVQVSVLPVQYVKAISGTKNVALAVTTGSGITVKAENLTFVDQYGNAFAPKKGDTVTVAFAPAENSNALNAKGGETLVVDENAPAGTSDVTVKITAINGKALSTTDQEDSAYSFTVARTSVENLSNFAIADIKYVQHAASNFSEDAIKVTGSANGVEYTLATSDYTIRKLDPSQATQVPAIAGDAIKTLDGTVSVAIANKAGTVVSKGYKYSNDTKGQVTYATKNEKKGDLPKKFDTTELVNHLTILNQYGEPIAPEATFVTLSGYGAQDTVVGNSTENVTFETTSTKSIHAVITFKGVSVTLEADFDIQ